MNLKKILIGDTLKVTWINSGITPSTILMMVRNSSDTLVSSAAMTSSGNGHYYGLYTLPNTTGYYVAETIATISTYPYKDRIKFKAVTGEAD